MSAKLLKFPKNLVNTCMFATPPFGIIGTKRKGENILVFDCSDLWFIQALLVSSIECFSLYPYRIFLNFPLFRELGVH